MVYVIVITWARGICLIYMPKPEGRRPEGAGLYIRKIPSAHVITNIFHFRHSKNLPKLTSIIRPLYIVTGTRCDCGARFYRCHDVLAW